jgi:hypothetical protein
LAAILSTNHRFYFHPGRLRQSCVAVWVMATGFGLYQLLGLTGLALAAIYVTAGIRENRRHCQLELILAGKEAQENGSPRSHGRSTSPADKAAPNWQTPAVLDLPVVCRHTGPSG